MRSSRCDTAECLYGKSATEVNTATPLTEYPSWGADDLLDLPTKNVFIGAIIVVDGALVSAPPLELWEKEEGLKVKTYPDVPLLIGTMAQENDEVTDPAVRAWDWKALDAHINATLGTFGGDLAHNASALYPRAGREPDYVLTSMSSDRTMRDVVAEFARTGKIGEPQWRTFPESTALLGASGGVEVARHYHAKQCALWLTNGLFSYAWIN
ncbi:PREDICTED: uncharacterized protein LOC106814464 [Priapulus caudatus]|uniref:Uncharacterized protein LOC106814464 n=1 Tax=Priapulus caudatus TaxID=37621 RepID=A0ABM1EPZ5_PRICU|nr:PREDICTED: uncharacterized protein LOC106814464 [Priapulus caudatus]